MKFGDVTVHVVPAVHSSDPGGRPLGFVLEFADGRTLYHTGDTWVFGDMALIEELYHPNILLFGVGGGPYTQDPEDGGVRDPEVLPSDDDRADALRDLPGPRDGRAGPRRVRRRPTRGDDDAGPVADVLGRSG